MSDQVIIYGVHAPKWRTRLADQTGLGRRLFRWTVYRIVGYPQRYFTGLRVTGRERVSEHWTYTAAAKARDALEAAGGAGQGRDSWSGTSARRDTRPEDSRDNHR